MIQAREFDAMYFALDIPTSSMIYVPIPNSNSYHESIKYISEIGYTNPIPQNLIDELDLLEEENLQRFLREVRMFRENKYGPFFILVDENTVFLDKKDGSYNKIVAKNAKDAIVMDENGFSGIIPLSRLYEEKLFEKM